MSEEERLRAALEKHRLKPSGKLRRGSLNRDLAREIFRFQKKEKLSIRELASRLGLSTGQYSYICRAFGEKKVRRPSRPRFRQIALADSSGELPGQSSAIEIRAGDFSFRVPSAEEALEIVRGLKRLES